MNLPTQIRMRNTMHGKRSKGGYFYRYSDVDGLGVNALADKLDRNTPEKVTWSFAWLPDREFKDYEDLRAAVEALSDDEIAAAKARFPVIEEIEPADSAMGNTCRLCKPRSPAAWQGTLGVSPDPMDSWPFWLCDTHRPLADKPAELLAALKADVEERRQARAAQEQAS